MHQHRWSRHDSGVSFGSSPACLFASTSSLPETFSSDSNGSSSPPSLSSSASPASSIASSPALSPSQIHSPIPDDLTLSPRLFKNLLRLDTQPPITSENFRPSSTELAEYAANVIRKEALALLALADRIGPASIKNSCPSPNVISSEDEVFGFNSDSDNESYESRSSNSSAQNQQIPESRTNIAFRQVIDSLSNLPPHGKIVVTGVGKSGIVGRKMVATFCSLGMQSVFLHPLEALHGDLGVICSCSPGTACDALLMISHSGATAELMRLLPIVRPRVRTLVAVTRDPDSVLARGCTGWLDAGTGFDTAGKKDSHGEKMTDEADSVLPAPTSSVVAAVAVGDALALTLSRLRLGWNSDGKARRKDFLRNHMGGQIGIELTNDMRREAM